MAAIPQTSTRYRIHLGLVAGLLGTVVIRVAGQDQAPSQVISIPEQAMSTPKRLETDAIENLFQVSGRLFSGGQPNGEKGFRELSKLGVKTILSVDGARPDVEAARRAGMRYVHIPVGYDGVSRPSALQIVKAVTTLPGPIFIHCHHGKHRGPSAVALCGLATDGWSHTQALNWLKQAGTSTDYQGLFSSVRGFVAPSAAELAGVSPDLPAQAKVNSLIEAMVAIDEHWDRLKASRGQQEVPSKGEREIDPAHEALLLSEAFRELTRLEETRTRGDDLVARMHAAERASTALRSALSEAGPSPSPASRARVDSAFAAVSKTCSSCHAQHRDRGSHSKDGTGVR